MLNLIIFRFNTSVNLEGQIVKIMNVNTERQVNNKRNLQACPDKAVCYYCDLECGCTVSGTNKLDPNQDICIPTSRKENNS